jgi:hypothetical protein
MRIFILSLTRKWTPWLLALVAVLAFHGPAAAQQTPDPSDAMLQRIRPSIVQIRVVGDVGQKLAADNGTGFVIETSAGPRVITAGHVIHPDSYWDDPKQRLIYVKWSAFGSALEPDPVSEAVVDDKLDLAQIYIDPFKVTALPFSSRALQPADKFFVPSWTRAKKKATIQLADRLADSAAGHLTMSGTFDFSDSGSPVLDSDGKIVGMLVDRSVQPGGEVRGLAIPLPGTSDLSKLVAQIQSEPVLKQATISRAEIDFGGLAGTCTFLGKRSALETRKPEDMPFGLDVLRRAINADNRPKLVGDFLRVVTGVNLRSRCPVLIEGAAYYGKIVAALNPSDTVVPRIIYALGYLDDVFYWTTVDKVAKAQ